MGDFSAKYNPTEVYNNLKYSKSNSKIKSQPKITNKNNFYFDNSVYIATEINFNSICLSCIASKQTCTIVCNTVMIEVDKKLYKIHIDLWGLHYSALLLGKTNAPILLDAKI